MTTTPVNTVSPVASTTVITASDVKWTERRVPFVVGADGKASFITLAAAEAAGAVRPEPAPKPVAEPKAPTAKAVSPFVVASSETHRLMGKLALEAAASAGDEQASAELARRAHNKGLKAAPAAAPVESKPVSAPAAATAPAAVKGEASERAAFIRRGLASGLLSQQEALNLLLG